MRRPLSASAAAAAGSSGTSLGPRRELETVPEGEGSVGAWGGGATSPPQNSSEGGEGVNSCGEGDNPSRPTFLNLGSTINNRLAPVSEILRDIKIRNNLHIVLVCIFIKF